MKGLNTGIGGPHEVLDLLVDLFQVAHITSIVIEHVAEGLGIAPTGSTPDLGIDVILLGGAEEDAAGGFQAISWQLELPLEEGIGIV